MIIFIKPNVKKDRYIAPAKKVIKALSSLSDIECVLSRENSLLLFGNEDYCQKTIEDCELLVSIGGDGTVLKAATLALEYDLPLVGINAGRLGCLCAYKSEDIIKREINPFINLKASKRSVLSLDYKDKTYTAINDFVFASKNSGYTVEVKIQVGENEFLYHASGVIVASATGSSAYNAAARGSIICGNLAANVITPICPFDKEKNSFVFDNKNDIIVTNNRMDDPIEICCDGVTIGIMDSELVVKKYCKELLLMHNKD